SPWVDGIFTWSWRTSPTRKQAQPAAFGRVPAGPLPTWAASHTPGRVRRSRLQERGFESRIDRGVGTTRDFALRGGDRKCAPCAIKDVRRTTRAPSSDGAIS